MGGIYLIGILFAVIGLIVQSQLKSKIRMYSQMGLHKGMSGKEIAVKMLMQHGIVNVRIISVDGQLSDHYNPSNRTVNLSHDVYHGRNVVSVAIAAHECGHAIQHQQAYPLIGFRSAIVPAVNIAGTILPWLLMFGVMLMQSFPALLLIAIIAQGLITVFTLITLPVEFDASRRALNWMETQEIVLRNEHDAARDALKWAAMTYVVAALAAIAQLVYLISRYSGSRKN